MGKARIELLGECRLALTDGDSVPVAGVRRQTAVAIAALSEPGLTDAKMATLLSRGRGGYKTRTGETAVRTLRNRLPGEIKVRLGDGARRWSFRDVEVDVLELKDEARNLLRAKVEADGEALRRVLDCLGKSLLPDIAPDSAGQTDWLVAKRAEIEGLRLELIDAAIAWAEHRSDSWSVDLREVARELRPEAVPEPPEGAGRSRPGPAISNIWPADEPELVGRERELKKLKTRFGEGSKRQVIWGAAGIGKSALAAAFVNENVNDYRLRWRLDAETDVKLREGLRRLGRKLGIASADGATPAAEDDPDAEQFLADLGDHLSSNLAGHWLLLFDNAERPDTLEPVWAHLPNNGDVLITSQWQDWEDAGVHDLHLWNLSLDDATRLLASASRRLADGDEDLPKICQVLECHPMLLKHAGKTMYSDGIGSTQYLQQLRTGIERAVRLWPELGVTRRHAITTYRLAIERATAAAPGAGSLMQIVSFLGPELVTETILHGGIVGCVSELGDADAVTRARRELRNRSLIEDYQRTESFTVPAVTQAVVRISLGPEEMLACLGTAVEALRSSLPAADAPDAFEQRRWLAPHIEAVVAHVEEHGDSDLRTRAAELASQLGLFRRSQAEWAAAEAAHKRAVDLSRDDDDGRAAAMRGVRLANVIRHRARIGDAEIVMASALPALRAAADTNDVDLSYALTVQARILRRKPGSSPVEAHRYLEEALEILDRNGADADTEQLSRTLNYSAVLLRQLGRYDEAEAQSRRGFQLLTGQEPEQWMRGDAGQEGPPGRLVAIHLRSLGNLWRLLGRFRESREAHDRALGIVKELYGDDHTDIGVCLDSIGRTQREYGDFTEALESFNRGKEIAENRFEDDVRSATALANIAITLGELERPEEALEAAETAVDICRRNYGDSWVDSHDRGVENVGELSSEFTAWTVFVRARFRALGGDLPAAERDHREVLRLRKKLYGGDGHPHVAASLQGLADVAAMDDRGVEAIDLHRQAKAIRVAVFGGEDNYWVAQSDARLGELLADAADQRSHLEAAERVWAEQLAPGHPWLRQVRESIAALG